MSTLLNIIVRHLVRLGRELLANLDEAPVEVRRLLLAEDGQGAAMARPRSGAGKAGAR